MDSLSVFPNEEEVLLAAGVYFKVSERSGDVPEGDTPVIIKLQLIGKKNTGVNDASLDVDTPGKLDAKKASSRVGVRYDDAIRI